MKIKIAAVQFKIENFKPEINLKRMEKFIKIAKERKAEIVIFPEVAVTPTAGKREFFDFKGRYKNYFQKLTQKYSTNICPGSFIEKGENGFYNTAYFIDQKGEIKEKYLKIHLTPQERKYLKSGNKVCVFNTKYGKFGILICWDLVLPEVFRELIKEGAKLIFLSELLIFLEKVVNFQVIGVKLKG
jgi:predicted amidohydrolase